MFVAKAVLPIEGLPAIINRSDLCRPPSFSSKSLNPVGTPTIPSSFLYAVEAISIVNFNASSNLTIVFEKEPFSARSNKDFSEFSIIV